MRIYSNKLTGTDLVQAANLMPEVVIEVRHTFEPKRNYTYGYDAVLASTRDHGRASAGMPGYMAATWDEFGIFMDKLFSIDPNARIGYYNGRDDFIAKTADEYNRRKFYGHDRRKVEAPWLVKN